MRIAPTLLAATLLAGCAALAGVADPASDAPEAGARAGLPFTQARTYQETLKLWQSAADINAWIGARFNYDLSRALQLSETQRHKNARIPIHEPESFFGAPSGVCVDLARFAVEALKVVDPGARPAYLMIEFDPVTIAGNTLRRHWVVSFRKDGKRYFFADSKRPGHIAGPYEDTQAFIAGYARYRGRSIVSFREVDSYERKMRTLATRGGGPEQRTP